MELVRLDRQKHQQTQSMIGMDCKAHAANHQRVKMHAAYLFYWNLSPTTSESENPIRLTDIHRLSFRRFGSYPDVCRAGRIDPQRLRDGPPDATRRVGRCRRV